MARKPTPNKRTPVREQTILLAIEWGATWKAAAGLAGVTPRTLDQWRQADPDFDQAVKRAKERLHAKQRKALGE